VSFQVELAFEAVDDRFDPLRMPARLPKWHFRPTVQASSITRIWSVA